MNDLMREFLAASRRLRGIVAFTVANEMATDGDLAVVRSWLDALSRLDHGGGMTKVRRAAKRGHAPNGRAAKA